jgi:hypothetical protein
VKEPIGSAASAKLLAASNPHTAEKRGCDMDVQENKRASKTMTIALKAQCYLKEGLVRVELTMADLQSAALATWLQPLT